YQLMIADEVFRVRFRKSFEQPEPVEAGEGGQNPIDLPLTDHRFKKGHKIMVQIQSTRFPVIDPQPHKFLPHTFQAKGLDYTSATQRVYRSPDHSTHIELSVLP